MKTSPIRRPSAVDWTACAGAVFDLDGVITNTAVLHARAWKRALDDLLALRAARGDPAFEPFSIEPDFARLVDGLPRLDGVRAFAADRGIALAEGRESDGAAEGTVRGVGAHKNAIYLGTLEREPAPVFEDAVACLRALKGAGVRLAIVSSSRNAARVLASAGLADLFEARVDGATLDETGLPGKPAPDMFLEALRRIGVAPGDTVAFEDAPSGVRAACAAGFATVVGVDRAGVADALREAGAHAVIERFNGVGPWAAARASTGRAHASA